MSVQVVRGAALFLLTCVLANAHPNRTSQVSAKKIPLALKDVKS